ncbi:MAG: lactate racemase domain-containing protein [Desulfobacterales bacterium]|nr:lactate racemase domain-containing protein [Desulfobacterales bacterium]MDD4072450.1 lactate racemase domain-containing protein [Desulfobacterales bacterium]MDD4392720.1 lactate racemase domain-containing protein [Desulfobacterales bacterium]
MLYPKMVKIRQRVDSREVKDIDAEVRSELKKINISDKIQPGDRVAITAGSRGISNIAEIIKTVVDEIKTIGADPFIFPAMGSHGGATASGQLEIIEDYGISERTMGVPVVSSMETVNIGETENGIPVYIDKHASEADHIIVVNRIKKHTEFNGCIESGLMKMMVIGMGKHKGAIIAHKYAVKYGYEKVLTAIGKSIIKNAPICIGIGIIENGYGKTAQITAVDAGNIYETEKKLLELSRGITPKLPFDDIDILIVDECGKHISGTGMDTKVVGRLMNIYETPLTHPKITRIILRNLSDGSHGNAIGMGLADFITRKVFDKIDYRSTYVNSITATTPEKARIPVICENDREALDFALATAGPVEMDSVKIVWIRNTSDLFEVFVSHGFMDETKKRSDLDVIGLPLEMIFDESGNLVELW